MSRDIILKLEGLDDFQKVCGFTRGLNAKIQKHVLSKDPQTLDKAIKQTHVYADPFEDNDDGKSSQKSLRPFNSSGSQSNTQNTQKK